MPDEANLFLSSPSGGGKRKNTKTTKTRGGARSTALDLRRLEQLGALTRVQAIQDEIAKIFDEFPELRRAPGGARGRRGARKRKRTRR
jgi:hypothetical protein